MTIALIGASLIIQAQAVIFIEEDDPNNGGNGVPYKICGRWSHLLYNPIDSTDNKLLFISRFVPNDTTPSLTIRVNINVWRNDDGSGNFWQEDPAYWTKWQDFFTYLNRRFVDNESYSDPVPGALFLQDSKIRFEIGNIYYYNSTEMVNLLYDATKYSNYFGRLKRFIQTTYPQNWSDECFNMHFMPSGSLGGRAMAQGRNACVVTGFNTSFNFQTHGLSIANKLASILGHNLDLNDTYDPNNYYVDMLLSHPDFLWDVYGHAIQSWCYGNYYDNYYVCPHETGVYCDPWDNSKHCTNNVMGGTSYLQHFSALQMGRMHRTLRSAEIRCSAYGYHEIPIVVRDTQLWDFPQKFYQDVIIDAGGLVMATCTTEFVPRAKVVIRPGGKLIINGGTFTHAYKDSLWQGIVVLGSPQFDKSCEVIFDNPQIDEKQGVIELKNGALIENAICGIYVGNQGDCTYGNGGIIRADRSIFRNNENAVVMREFANYGIEQTYELLTMQKKTSLVEKNNASYFEDCQFITDAQMLSGWQGNTGKPMVELYGVRYVKFGGCQFLNNPRFVGPFYINNGYYLAPCAIYANNAGIYLTQSSNTWQKNLIQDFYAGIRLTNSGTHASWIEETDFVKNHVGIIGEYINFPVITKCDFNLDAFLAETVITPVGISLTYSDLYTIQENDFHGQDGIGIVVDNSGIGSNEINNNTFTGLCEATYASGVNGSFILNVDSCEGLQYFCNIFTNNQTDIKVTPAFAEIIRYSQGYPSESAGNQFIKSPMNIDNGNNKNKCLWYFWYKPDPPYKPLNNTLCVDMSLQYATTQRDCSPIKLDATKNLSSEELYSKLTDIYNIYLFTEFRLKTVRDEFTGKWRGIDCLFIDEEGQIRCMKGGKVVVSVPEVDIMEYVYDLLEIARLRERLAILLKGLGHIIFYPENGNFDGKVVEVVFSDDEWLKQREAMILVESHAEIFNWDDVKKQMDAIKIRFPNRERDEYDAYQLCLEIQRHYYCCGKLSVEDENVLNEIIKNPKAGMAITKAKALLEWSKGVFTQPTIHQCYIPRENYYPAPNESETQESMNKKQNKNYSINLYPNPVTEILYISINSDNSVNIEMIEITDIVGRVLKTQTLSDITTSVNIKDLSQGMYFVRCRLSDGLTKTYRIVKH
jgi:hypothetical protein